MALRRRVSFGEPYGSRCRGGAAAGYDGCRPRVSPLERRLRCSGRRVQRAHLRCLGWPVTTIRRCVGGQHSQLQARDQQVEDGGGQWSEQPRCPAADPADCVDGPNDGSESNPVEEASEHTILPAFDRLRVPDHPNDQRSEQVEAWQVKSAGGASGRRVADRRRRSRDPRTGAAVCRSPAWAPRQDRVSARSRCQSAELRPDIDRQHRVLRSGTSSGRAAPLR